MLRASEGYIVAVTVKSATATAATGVTLAAIDDARIKTSRATRSYFSSTYRIGWLDILQCEKRPIFYLRSVRLRDALWIGHDLCIINVGKAQEEKKIQKYKKIKKQLFFLLS